ncbi:hypothetical protein QCA50_004801 [Cerrena zonata]|uniref:Polysaccharide lyase 14 domain-containing protein n=1 Tax=Cerrena zonata TaxID=2478898 RepID=A0AAW0GFK8_9APHY
MISQYLGIIHPLFPVPSSSVKTGFTTSISAGDKLPQIQILPLLDEVLGVHRVNNRTTHQLTVPPSADDDHAQAWEAFFPEGCINPGNKVAPMGGFGFFMKGPNDFATELGKATSTHVLFNYEVLFESEWEWRKGGKLPGIFGGAGDAAYTCTGGRQSDGKCFNLRLMWRENGKGELYAYLPLTSSNTEHLLSVPPRSIQHPDYGFSVGRGAFTFVPGRWTTIAERIKLNTIGYEDGEIEVFIDGKSVILATGLILRDSTAIESRVRGLHFQTFFGGHAPEWASPKTQRAWFTNVSGAILTDERGIHRDEL